MKILTDKQRTMSGMFIKLEDIPKICKEKFSCRYQEIYDKYEIKYKELKESKPKTYKSIQERIEKEREIDQLYDKIKDIEMREISSLDEEKRIFSNQLVRNTQPKWLGFLVLFLGLMVIITLSVIYQT
jgi:Fe2+ transport system protein B